MTSRRDSPTRKAPVRASGLRYILIPRNAFFNIKNSQNRANCGLSVSALENNAGIQLFCAGRPTNDIGTGISSFRLRQTYRFWTENIPQFMPSFLSSFRAQKERLIYFENIQNIVFLPQYFETNLLNISERSRNFWHTGRNPIELVK